MAPRSLSRTRRAGGAGVLLAVAGAGIVGPAHAAPKSTPDVRRAPVQSVVLSCEAPSDALRFGGAAVRLTLATRWLAADDVLVLVPVVDATGLDAGERTTAGRADRAVTVVVPADGTAPTPASTVEVRLGGDVLQRVPVAGGCGVLDPAPEPGPVVEQLTTGTGTVTVQVRNPSSVADEVGVTLFPAGGSVGESRFLALAPATSGAVTFSGVAPGQYTVELFGYTTFVERTTEPFTVS